MKLSISSMPDPKKSPLSRYIFMATTYTTTYIYIYTVLYRIHNFIKNVRYNLQSKSKYNRKKELS